MTPAGLYFSSISLYIPPTRTLFAKTRACVFDVFAFWCQHHSLTLHRMGHCPQMSGHLDPRTLKGKE